MFGDRVVPLVLVARIGIMLRLPREVIGYLVIVKLDEYCYSAR